VSVDSDARLRSAAGERAGPARFLYRIVQSENAFLALILAAMLIGFTLLTPSGTFLSALNFKNMALDTSEIVVLAAGMTFVIIAAGIDLSIGSVVVFSSVAFAEVMTRIAGTAGAFVPTAHHLALAISVGVLAALASGLFWGSFNGYLIGYRGIPAFVVTLGTLGIALGLAQVITSGVNIAGVPIELQTSLGSGELFGTIPWLVVLAAAVVAVLWIVLAQTRYGLRTYALGASQEATQRAGINIKRHTLSIYMLMGLLAGVVGVMDVSRFATASIAAHSQDNLAAIAAVVIGGTSLFGGKGRMSGTVIGAFIPAVLRNGFILMGVQPFWQNVAVGAVLILAVYIDQVRRRRAQFV
jgi:ribose transport system permease protein